MNIGFDAKRAFLNQSGLGNYSRALIKSLADNFPGHHYSLFTTQKGHPDFSAFTAAQKDISVILPQKFLDKRITANWRSYVITELLAKNKIDVYHGLSNELPFNIHKFKGRKIVTIHDLIFLRYPKLYSLIDRKIYNRKFRSACELADVIIATSEQTRRDIMEFYGTDPKKIKVVYQSCDEVFYNSVSTDQARKVISKYNLPPKYLLNVGTIEERKNLLTVLQALTAVKDILLVVIGKKKTYFKKILKFIRANKLEKRVVFLENVSTQELQALYKGAEIFIYPSLFEGFGIPIIEALTAGTPVITTKGGCFPEVGGKNSIYIDPASHEQLAEEIKKLLASAELRKSIVEKGLEHSKLFLPETIASEMIKIYSNT